LLKCWHIVKDVGIFLTWWTGKTLFLTQRSRITFVALTHSVILLLNCCFNLLLNLNVDRYINVHYAAYAIMHTLNDFCVYTLFANYSSGCNKCRSPWVTFAFVLCQKYDTAGCTHLLYLDKNASFFVKISETCTLGDVSCFTNYFVNVK